MLLANYLKASELNETWGKILSNHHLIWARGLVPQLIRQQLFLIVYKFSLEKFTRRVGLPFLSLLPEATIQEALNALEIKYRRRLFDQFVTLWAFLSQVLDADKSCDNAVSRAIAWDTSEDVELPSQDTAAY